MTAHVLQANARMLPLADDTVDLVVTSPPYFALRSYQDAGVHYAGQIGDEPTPAEFVDSLLAVTAECMRVLKSSGSLWVNLGDKYSTGSRGDRNNGFNERFGNAPGKRAQETSQLRSPAVAGMRPKSLIGIPWRYALRCIDDLGLILRAEVIWSKPNGLPESVTDRVRRSHEQWFHFTLNPRYYSAVDEIREAHQKPRTAEQMARDIGGPKSNVRHGGHQGGSRLNGDALGYAADATGSNPLGKLPGSVWTIPTEPLTVPEHLGVDHFAAFPTEWPKRIIAGWSPAGVCVACGEGRRPVAERTSDGRGRSTTAAKDPSWVAINRADWQENVLRTITGYACACPEPTAPTTPGVVLDCFGGTGTTAMVATALGRTGISVDMSADYCRLAQWRTSDRNQLAKVLGMEKTAPPDEAQLDLFGGVA